MEIDVNWLGEVGLDTNAGLSYTGSPEKYISAVSRFYKNYEKNKIKVDEYLFVKDYENYMITVHALKSNARMIGATTLSGSFETLEMAARDNDAGLIGSLTAPVMSDYAELIKKLEPIAALKDASAADEISADVARQTADELLAALDDFDDELSRKLVKKLSGFPFRMTQADRLKEAASYIEDFMYDEAADIIREIVPTIEQG